MHRYIVSGNILYSNLLFAFFAALAMIRLTSSFSSLFVTTPIFLINIYYSYKKAKPYFNDYYDFLQSPAGEKFYKAAKGTLLEGNKVHKKLLEYYVYERGKHPNWRTMGHEFGKRTDYKKQQNQFKSYPEPNEENNLSKASQRAFVGNFSDDRIESALKRMGLSSSTDDFTQVKTQYQTLMELHHPDQDKNEERAKQIIEDFQLLERFFGKSNRLKE